jgi:hypothetical protein
MKPFSSGAAQPSAAALMTIIICLTCQLRAQPAVMLEKTLAPIRRVQTVSCSIVRKQSYKGFQKTAHCEFHYSRKQGKFAYIYAPPYDYSFWIDDSAVCGVKRDDNQGYRIAALSNASKYRTLQESVHLCRPLFQCAEIDPRQVSLKASIDDSLYFEYPAGNGREVVKVDQRRNVVEFIETFDSTGALRRQTLFKYESKKGKAPLFPCQIVTRDNTTGVIETDTILITNVEINKDIEDSVFMLPMVVGAFLR